MVVEEFIVGDLYSTDIYVDAKGKVYVLPFIHFQNGSMAGMDGYQVYQSETHHTLSDAELEHGAAVARKALHAVGLRSSVAHIELFHTASGWKIIELGPRIGGYRHDILKQAYGINHIVNDIRNRGSEAPVVPLKMHNYVAEFDIYARTEGTLRAVHGLKKARSLSNIVYQYIGCLPD